MTKHALDPHSSDQDSPDQRLSFLTLAQLEEVPSKQEEPLNIMTIDCCEHTIRVLGTVRSSQLTSISLGLDGASYLLERKREIDLIVIGVSNYPVRRVFISQIRALYPDTPMLVLRRAENATDASIRGEFILSDQGHGRDLDLVSAVRSVMPLTGCGHTPRSINYDVMGEVMRVITEKYSDADLDLEKVASALSLSAVHLSRILNQSVGVSFRQLLRNTRIEEAKRLLASNRYSVKEVAALVGFADNHYFSRSFKEATGQSASEYRSRYAMLLQ